MVDVGDKEVTRRRAVARARVTMQAATAEALAGGTVAKGDVLAVGPGRRSEQTGDLVPMDVAEGDTVVYSKYGGTEITVEGEDLLILNARDVLAIVK